MSENASSARREILVWDAPVRIVHWLLVALVLTSWITSEIGGNAMTYHMWSGYAILTLVAFRIVWGFVGSEHARFSGFLYGPAAIYGYASSLLCANSRYYVGHNPLGGVSVVLLLASLLLQAATGLFANDDIATEGPLAPLVSGDTSSLLTTIHRWNFYVLASLAGLHIAAVLFYLIVKRDNLTAAMLTGRKQAPAHLDPPIADGRMASPWLALGFLAALALAVAALVNWS